MYSQTHAEEINTGFPPGSVGDLSVRIGYDVRELLVGGYDMKDIQGVIDGDYTLEELLYRGCGKRERTT